MTLRKILLLVGVAVGLVLSGPTGAQTPDGATPAQESVCDKLKAEGVTKGLYGLCIAFCEAGDYASEDVPMTADEAAALSDSAPAGRILENYNRRKQSGDPDMPCVQVQSDCPCWTAEQIASIDGFWPDGTPSSDWCGGGYVPSQNLWFARFPWEPGQVAWAFYGALVGIPANYCRYLNTQASPPIDVTIQAGGDFTNERLAACLQQAMDACTAMGY